MLPRAAVGAGENGSFASLACHGADVARGVRGKDVPRLKPWLGSPSLAVFRTKVFCTVGWYTKVSERLKLWSCISTRTLVCGRSGAEGVVGEVAGATGGVGAKASAAVNSRSPANMGTSCSKSASVPSWSRAGGGGPDSSAHRLWSSFWDASFNAATSGSVGSQASKPVAALSCSTATRAVVVPDLTQASWWGQQDSKKGIAL